ncbi:hypothetical protein C0995_004984 [Termitomyces sp. Mi166|nr:hypothetical protein C0995_004984 [Termitomyces sp. Mi166\
MESPRPKVQPASNAVSRCWMEPGNVRINFSRKDIVEIFTPLVHRVTHLEDFFAMMAGIGCSISSVITLVVCRQPAVHSQSAYILPPHILKIFFPRSIEGEIAARDERRRNKSGRTGAHHVSLYKSHNESLHTHVIPHSTHTSHYETGSKSCLLTPSPKQDAKLDRDSVYDNYQSSPVHAVRDSGQTGSIGKYWADDDQDTLASLPSLRPNRKKGDSVELGSLYQVMDSSTAKLDGSIPNVNYMVHDFTSPIDSNLTPASLVP